ncbi:type VII secretion protein EccE [Kutzneria kofuensis]|uniref:Type VII secretion protein EccE n=1 Tax=Kutzneria kofuensis TaxID=103725 RepID=A0A7W9NJX1_9PSEU|nr:type VII secretion protein EccE [Kutzneria kofuensis]MBB5894771.1 type VII secretion protein EccE [Kutzneria kofuensis]
MTLADTRTRVRARWLRPVTAGQIAVWQIAALAVLMTSQPFDVTGIVVAAVAVLLIAVTSVRRGGLCLYQWIGVRLSYLRRSKPSPSQDPIAAVLPGLGFVRHVDRAGNRVGLASIGPDRVAVVRLPSGVRPELDVLVTALREAQQRTDIPLAGAQLVVWTVPGPTSVEPMRIHWLALRYRPSVAPGAALARGGGSTGSDRAAASAALGLVGRLAEAGQASAVLDEPELRQDLLVALGADPRAFAGSTPGARPMVKVDETWRTWSIGRLTQTSFAPGPRVATEVLGVLVPGTEFTCSSLLLRRTPRGTTETSVSLRVGYVAKHAQQRPEGLVKRLAADLYPANGRQSAALLRSLPLATPE